ncbi:short-subunit dehydrogenase [Crossiella equi]|uniref:Short-subunit dehydrogenase n=1 Tax=Crossiella equi TaxID=130796 RepID=A0ABS5AJC8_9PSEU|nr:SDR family oxidoreductase [Crossiella equi]MBP2476675.1 short-subunit dehydrogenase [Crossiella equi]
MSTPTALVTGASSGIGAATAKALVAKGFHVIGTSRDPDRIPPADRIPGVDYRPLDLTSEESTTAFAATLGDIDVLVNNAGESQSGPLEELPIDKVEDLFRLNVFGPVRLLQLVTPAMRARGRGRVVMVGSMLASFPLAYRSSYVATKAALRGFADAARHELSPFGVWVTTVEPGSINTGISTRRTKYIAEDSPHRPDFERMIAALDANEGKGISAETVAETILGAIIAPRPKPLYAVGSRAPLVFTLRRLLPRAAVLRMVARMHGLKR